jgi:hypothetical protein
MIRFTAQNVITSSETLVVGDIVKVYLRHPRGYRSTHPFICEVVEILPRDNDHNHICARVRFVSDIGA